MSEEVRKQSEQQMQKCIYEDLLDYWFLLFFVALVISLTCKHHSIIFKQSFVFSLLQIILEIPALLAIHL